MMDTPCSAQKFILLQAWLHLDIHFPLIKQDQDDAALVYSVHAGAGTSTAPVCCTTRYISEIQAHTIDNLWDDKGIYKD